MQCVIEQFVAKGSSNMHEPYIKVHSPIVRGSCYADKSDVVDYRISIERTEHADRY